MPVALGLLFLALACAAFVRAEVVAAARDRLEAENERLRRRLRQQNALMGQVVEAAEGRLRQGV